MINPEQEKNLTTAYQNSSKKKQDKTNPHVINVNDGRLMPNTERLRTHKDYRVYTGPKDATTEQRMKWLAGAQRRAPVVIDSSANAAPFDIGKASKEDLVVFAMENYGATLDSALPLVQLRTAVATLAKAESESLA